MRSLGIVALLLVCLRPTADAQPVTLNGALTVKSAQDFATLAFQDPWDMNEWTDVGAFATSVDQPASGLTNVSFTGGRFSATSSNGDPNFFLLETGNPNAAPIGKIGTNYPIAANTYRLLAFRMTVPAANDAQVIWYSNNIYQSSPNVLGNISTTAGDRTYFVDLPSLTAFAGSSWGGTVRTLRFDPESGVAGQSMSFDWFRLVSVDPGLCRQVVWTRAGAVDVYLDPDSTTNGNETLLARNVSNGAGTASAGCSAAATGHTFYAGALAPGTYFILVRPTGATTPVDRSSSAYTVNAIPTVNITSPSDEGSSNDFATAVLGNAWDMDTLADFDRYTNVSGQTIATIAAQTDAGASLGNVRVMQAASVNGNSDGTPGTSIGDPYMYFMWPAQRGATNRIDPTIYRILTIEFGLPNKPRDILQGSIARIVWRVAGDAAEAVSDDIIFNSRSNANVMNRIVVDMADRTMLPIEQGSTTGWVPGNSANPGLDILRFDPHEFTPATSFFVRRARLAALERLGPTVTYQIAFTKSEAGATARVYWDSDRNPASGTNLIGTTNGTSVTWTTPNPASATNYYIYVEVDDGTNTNGAYARWPVIVDPNLQPLKSLSLDRTNLNFGVMYGSSRYTTPAQPVRIDVTGVGPEPCWQIDTALSGSAAQYINVSPATGIGAGTFTVSVAGTPPVGTTTGTIRVRSCSTGAGFENSPRLMTFTIRATRSSSNPFGSFDSPVNGAANVSGSIPVTGWALDDIGVSAVKVYRDSVPEVEGGGALVFIGNAVLVRGARPDLEGAFSTFPLNDRGGWGYLLLTNMLPDRIARTTAGGNGVFTLHAFAQDLEGHQVLLGSKTITLNNAAATKPFGAIDTPAQGATVSGTVNNFGWALTQAPKTIPSSGSTIQVVVDGVALGNPSPLSSRPDIVALFSGRGYNDIDHHLGVFALDTTALSNGVHTIAWSVTDTGGQADGIGSRYFTVQNDAGLLAAAVPAGPDSGQTFGFSGTEALAAAGDPRAVPDLGGAVRVRTGFDLGAPLETIRPGAGSRRLIRAREMDRLEIHLGEHAGPGVTFRGHLNTPAGLRPLPIGSTLDPSTGTFTWQPGVGFIGDYDLVFTRATLTKTERIPVRVRLEPAHQPAAPRADVRMAIDAPVRGAVRVPFVVGGWAIDLGAEIGTGIDAVHVWAYPIVDGVYGNPFFLGQASYGDARPDVAAYFGPQFTWSAYGLVVHALPTGMYDIAVFARSTVQQTFAPARVVRVVIR